MFNVTRGFLILITAAIAGCSSVGDFKNSRPYAVSELYKVREVLTPTRIRVEREWRSYVLDLAYFVPETQSCQVLDCGALEQLVQGQSIWAVREYDRWGLQMHSIWIARKGVDKPDLKPLNIKLIQDGDYTANVDYRRLPNGMTKLVARSNEVGINNQQIKAATNRLQPWQKNLVEKLGGE